MKYWRGYLIAAIIAFCGWMLEEFAASHSALVDMIYPYMTRLIVGTIADWTSGFAGCLWQTLLVVLVLLGIGGLVADARKMGAQVALYGHTHRVDCHQEPDGMWVMNPGSCGSMGGTAGVIKIEDGEVKTCYFITQEDLEEML